MKRETFEIDETIWHGNRIFIDEIYFVGPTLPPEIEIKGKTKNVVFLKDKIKIRNTTKYKISAIEYVSEDKKFYTYVICDIEPIDKNNTPEICEVYDQVIRKVTEEYANALAKEIETYDPILIGVIQNILSQSIVHDICGVQPMTGPTGSIFTLNPILPPTKNNTDEQDDNQT